MRDEVREAIEAACSAGSQRTTGFDVMKAKLLEAVRNLPDGMSVGELREELEE